MVVLVIEYLKCQIRKCGYSFFSCLLLFPQMSGRWVKLKFFNLDSFSVPITYYTLLPGPENFN